MRTFIVITLILLVSPLYADEDYTFRKSPVNVVQLTNELKSRGVPIYGVSKLDDKITVHVRGSVNSSKKSDMSNIVLNHVEIKEKSKEDWKEAYNKANSLDEKVDILANYMELK